MNHIVRFADGILVEVAPNPDPVHPVSGKQVERSAQAFQAAADAVAASLRAVVQSVKQAARTSGAESVELEFGIGFSIEGNAFITKMTGSGNIAVRVKLDGAVAS